MKNQPTTHNPNHKCTKHLQLEQSMVKLSEELKALKKMQKTHPTVGLSKKVDSIQKILFKYDQEQRVIFAGHYHDVPAIIKEKKYLFPPIKGSTNA